MPSSEEKAGYKPYDNICRVCKEREHNHTKWICTECATESMKYLYGDKGLPPVPKEKTCNGICLTGWEIGVPSSGIAYAHPECELHGWDEDESICFHDYPDKGIGCLTCEAAND